MKFDCSSEEYLSSIFIKHDVRRDRLLDKQELISAIHEVFDQFHYHIVIENYVQDDKTDYATFKQICFNIRSSHVSYFRKYRLLVWQVFENPGSSLIARLWSTLATFVILLSTVSFCVSTLPNFYTEAEPGTILSHTHPAPQACLTGTPGFTYSAHVFSSIEEFCISVFTLDYGARLLLHPTPHSCFMNESLSQYLRSRLRFAMVPMNVIDFLAIAPFYIELAAATSGGKGLAIIRVVRVARIFRLLKLGKHQKGLAVIMRTFRRSWRFLVSISFVIFLIQIVTASLIFSVENGEICLIEYKCSGGSNSYNNCTAVTFADGSVGWLTSASVHIIGYSNRSAATDNRSFAPNASFPDPSACLPDGVCTDVGNLCIKRDGTRSQFNSIPNALWWSMVTMTTIGFPPSTISCCRLTSSTPETPLGYLIGGVAAILGVVVLAMPTTVIGTEFSEAYAQFMKEKSGEEEEEEMEDELLEMAERKAKDGEGDHEEEEEDTIPNNIPVKHKKRFLVELNLYLTAQKV
ncbi:hypothetical protein GUITHDRAFT_135686 [Guillardia theta CCMP2712]|uniref:EF-hand domain-containing protein n=1 Tax=Guillardia theta (strain CCMP2712) TaxID=905079 RepID=L1JP85_GUITC|nr:hypothetical protein GUITHDRAFT_135686 [Guillardia theta CCMP2712]EKX50010.1 hypothetical protein GUITHDRAFT_135686 [Guillardia theta CCMP2712]|eukprot:XP_005836990.1 hypothetical protein GUITHDRAFT_135686 [Guillardia theta CCMP2712]